MIIFFSFQVSELFKTEFKFFTVEGNGFCRSKLLVNIDIKHIFFFDFKENEQGIMFELISRYFFPLKISIHVNKLFLILIVLLVILFIFASNR